MGRMVNFPGPGQRAAVRDHANAAAAASQQQAMQQMAMVFVAAFQSFVQKRAQRERAMIAKWFSEPAARSST